MPDFKILYTRTEITELVSYVEADSQEEAEQIVLDSNADNEYFSDSLKYEIEILDTWLND